MQRHVNGPDDLAMSLASPHGTLGRAASMAAAMVSAAMLLAAGCAPQGADQSLAPAAQRAAAPAATAAERIAKGEELAKTYCASCHAVGRTGDSPAPPAPPFRTLASLYSLDTLEEALAEGILVGHPMMPEFKFSPGQIEALIAYLRTVQKHARG